MKARHGAQWLAYASRAAGGDPGAALDEYGLLKTMIDQWRDVFDDAFGRNEKHAVRNFASMALHGRNATYHLSRPLQDDEALRYLDAMHQLLKAANAPPAEIAEIKKLYDEQRRQGIDLAAPSSEHSAGRAPTAHTAVTEPKKSIGRTRSKATIEARVLAYVMAHPDLDDDELSLRLDIRPRQSINLAARRLEAAGKLRRVRGPNGKIVNRARGTGQ